MLVASIVDDILYGRDGQVGVDHCIGDIGVRNLASLSIHNKGITLCILQSVLSCSVRV